MVEQTDSAPLRILGLATDVDFRAGVGDAIGSLLGAVFPALPFDEGAPGRIVVHYTPTSDTGARMLVGVEWDGPPVRELELLERPARPVARAVHAGAWSGLPETHQAVHAWMHARGLREVGENWEVYEGEMDDPATLRTAVCYALPAP